MQVDGYSLDAQRDKLKKYAEYQELVIAGEYSDEGKSGKSVEGRPQFMQIEYSVAMKSRFRRNGNQQTGSRNHQN